MRQPRRIPLTRLLTYGLLILAFLYLELYLFLAYKHVAYPYELEWMEGGLVDGARRLLSGQRLYAAPSVEWVPFIYTPLYFGVSAAVARWTGIGFLPLRLVSLASSVGSLALLFAFVRRETRSALCGILAACLFAGTYHAGGAWLDLARVDALFLLLTLGSVFALRSGGGAGTSIVAGVLTWLAFMAKQSALMVALPLSVYGLVYGRRWARLAYPLTVLVLTGASTLLLDRATGGWYSYYVFELPRQHELVASVWVTYWTDDLAKPLAVACALSLFYLLHLAHAGKRREAVFFTLFFGGAVGASWFSRLHLGGYANVLLPAYAAISMGFGLGAGALMPGAPAGPAEAGPAPARPDAPARQAHLALVLCIVQFLALFYNPLQLLPTEADAEAGRAFVRTLASIEGPVFVPYHGYLPSLAGKEPTAHFMAMYDVLRSTDQGVRDQLRQSLLDAFAEQRFGAIVLDEPSFLQEIEAHYVLQGPVFDQEDVFYPVTGLSVRPELLYVPAE